MTINTDRSVPRQGNFVTVADTDWGIVAKKSITFDGGTENAIGDYDGTGDPFTIFNVTGEVLVRVLAVCTTSVEGGSATIEVGTENDSSALIASTTGTDIDAGEIWHDATPDADIEASSVMTEYVLADGTNIEGTVGTANATAGTIDFYCFWYPLSEDGSVEGA